MGTPIREGTKHYEIWKHLVKQVQHINTNSGYRSRVGENDMRVCVVERLPSQNMQKNQTRAARPLSVVPSLDPQQECFNPDREDTGGSFKPTLIQICYLFADVYSHGDQPQRYEKYTRIGESLEVLHFGILAEFPDTDNYFMEERESDLVNDIKKAVMKKISGGGRAGAGGCVIDGVRDIRLVNWITAMVNVYQAAIPRDNLLFALKPDCDLFFHFEVIHVYPRIGGTAHGS